MPLPTIPPYPLPTAADIGPARIHWTPIPSRGALLVHDVQRHFLRPFEADWLRGSVVRHIAALARAFRAAARPVFFTAQSPDQTPDQRGLMQETWGSGLFGDDEGAAIDAEVDLRDWGEVVIKRRYSAFFGTTLASRLEASGCDELYVCGVYAHIGCALTCADAFMRDVRPFLVFDATADFGPDEHRRALAQVGDTCGAVCSTAALLSAVQAPADRASAVRRDLADVLDCPAGDITADADLRDLGLDSLRLMVVLERHRDRGIEVSFPEVAGCFTVADLERALGSDDV